MKNKQKPLNEIRIDKFINKFLDGIQKGTQERFIKQAEKAGLPKPITIRMAAVENLIKHLEDDLKDL
jgi:hypothetical protein